MVAEDGIRAGRDRRARHLALVVGDRRRGRSGCPSDARPAPRRPARAPRGCPPASRRGPPRAPRCGCAPACRAGRARSVRTACARASARNRAGAPRPSRPAAGSRNRRGRRRACRRQVARITGRRAASMFSPAPTTATPACSRWRKCLEEGLVAPVEAVIAGEGQHVEPGARDGGGAFRAAPSPRAAPAASRVPRVAKLVSSWPNTSSAPSCSVGRRRGEADCRGPRDRVRGHRSPARSRWSWGLHHWHRFASATAGSCTAGAQQRIRLVIVNVGWGRVSDHSPVSSRRSSTPSAARVSAEVAVQ